MPTNKLDANETFSVEKSELSKRLKSARPDSPYYWEYLVDALVDSLPPEAFVFRSYGNDHNTPSFFAVCDLTLGLSQILSTIYEQSGISALDGSTGVDADAAIDDKVSRLLQKYENAHTMYKRKILELFKDSLITALDETLHQMEVEVSATRAEINKKSVDLIKKTSARQKLRLNYKSGGSDKKLDRDRLSKLPRRYDELRANYAEVKRYCDDQRTQFDANLKIKKSWKQFWISKAKERFPHLDDTLLSQIGAPGTPLDSPTLPYKHLAKETGYKVSYIRKMLTKIRKDTED